MLRLITNELQKIIKRKKFIIAIAVFTAVTLMLCLYHYNSVKNIDTAYEIEWNTQKLLHLKAQRKDANLSEDEKKQIDRYISDTVEFINNYKAIDEEKDLDWKEQVRRQIGRLEKEKQKNLLIENKTQVEILNAKITACKYDIDNNIRHEKNDANAYPVFFVILNIVCGIFLSPVVAILSADIVSGEYVTPTIKLLLTKPVSKAKILFSKYITIVTASVFALILAEVAVFIILGMIGGFGNGSVRVPAGTEYIFDLTKQLAGRFEVEAVTGSTKIIPLWLIFVENMGLQALYIAACASFCFMLSTLTRNSVAATITGIMTTMAASLIILILNLRGGGSAGVVSKVIPFLFTTYSHTVRILGGGIINQYDLGYKLNSPFVTPFVGILVCIIWSAVCYIVSHIVFVKRDNMV